MATDACQGLTVSVDTGWFPFEEAMLACATSNMGAAMTLAAGTYVPGLFMLGFACFALGTDTIRHRGTSLNENNSQELLHFEDLLHFETDFLVKV